MQKYRLSRKPDIPDVTLTHTPIPSVSSIIDHLTIHYRALRTLFSPRQIVWAWNCVRSTIAAVVIKLFAARRVKRSTTSRSLIIVIENPALFAERGNARQKKSREESSARRFCSHENCSRPLSRPLFRPDSPARTLARIYNICATINPAPHAGVHISSVCYPATLEGILRNHRTARAAVNKIGKRCENGEAVKISARSAVSAGAWCTDTPITGVSFPHPCSNMTALPHVPSLCPLKQTLLPRLNPPYEYSIWYLYVPFIVPRAIEMSIY